MVHPPRPAPLGELFSARFVVVTGKGGVGKTTVAAALARVAAAQGKRVLAAEVGAAPGAPSPLLAALARPGMYASTEPLAVAPNIDCVLLTPEAGHRDFLRQVLPLGFLADAAMKAEPVRRFLSAAPAFAELGILYRGMHFLRQERRRGEPKWDVLVLDSPATGHAIAFASLPEVILKIIPVGPIARAVREGLEILNDPTKTVAVVTTLPEPLPVSEALELVAGLEKNRVRVHGIIANLVPHDPFSAHEHAAIAEWLGTGAERVLGSRTLSRLRRASTALDRLRSRAGRSLITLKERGDEGTTLIDRVAEELAGTP